MARLSALLAVVAALAIAPVQATMFASASASDFKITLFDLKPSDGITPRITFNNLRDNAAGVVAEDSGNIRISEASGTGPFDLKVSTGLSSARAVVAGRSPANVTSLTASGSALGTSQPGGVSAFFAHAISPSFSDFTLTANTLASFSVFANLKVSTT